MAGGHAGHAREGRRAKGVRVGACVIGTYRRRRGKVAPARAPACRVVGAGAMAGGQGSGQGVRGNGKLLLCVQVLGGGRGKERQRVGKRSKGRWDREDGEDGIERGGSPGGARGKTRGRRESG